MDVARAFIPMFLFWLAPLLIPVVAAIVGAVSDWMGRGKKEERSAGRAAGTRLEDRLARGE